MSEKDRIRLKNASRSKAKSSNWTLRFDWTLTESSDWTLRYDRSLPLIPLALAKFQSGSLKSLGSPRFSEPQTELSRVDIVLVGYSTL